MKLSYWLLLLLTANWMVGCKNLKKTKVEEITAVETTLPQAFVSIYEAPVAPPDSVDLDFRLVQTIPHKDSVELKMRYGGGCIKPHIFEMYTSAMPNKDGVIDIYLVHKTHNDYCKAFVFTARTFVWSHLFSPGKKVRINNGEIIEIPEK